MVVIQLAEQFLPMPEVCGSNPVIGKILLTYLMITVNMTKINKIDVVDANFY